MREITLWVRGMGGRIDTPGATFVETGPQQWRVDVHDGPHRRFIEAMLPTVGLYRLQRAVAPNEGNLYREAVLETFGRSSGLVLVESEAGPRGEIVNTWP